MNSKNEIYKIEFTEGCRDEIENIYEYIFKSLNAENAAKRLMNKMMKSIMRLEHSPNLFMKIEKPNKLKMDYRRIVIDNYVILYTVNETKKKVYIVHMYYGGQNYL